MNIKAIEADSLNDLLPIMDFSDEKGKPEFVLDWFPPDSGFENIVYMDNIATIPKNDYIKVTLHPISKTEDLLLERRKVLLAALKDITTKNRSLCGPRLANKSLKIGGYEIKYAEGGIGATPFKLVGNAWQYGIYIDYNRLLVEKLGD